MCLETIHIARRVAEVPLLQQTDFQPRGGTPLLDAIMDTIAAISSSLEGREPGEVKVIVAIQTDGEENASRRHGWEEVKGRICAMEQQGWEFIFMGAGLREEAYNMGRKLGLKDDKIVAYGTDREATRSIFEATAANMSLFASGMALSTSYSSAQKVTAGDAFGGDEACEDGPEPDLGGASGVDLDTLAPLPAASPDPVPFMRRARVDSAVMSEPEEPS
ncbi:hypothetical protein SAMN05660710_00729 [Paracoccus tibetensis]|uniref:VWFA domain-containing protein n=2 Tax=Paracoccus tibetensis TaxID=336292 RepID=A0A1G5DAL9_9RHOB|nr:hypothetical protein SAMN05660710_00729 [Paracoccus tibetensis]